MKTVFMVLDKRTRRAVAVHSNEASAKQDARENGQQDGGREYIVEQWGVLEIGQTLNKAAPAAVIEAGKGSLWDRIKSFFSF
jgi:hypothetical protein